MAHSVEQESRGWTQRKKARRKMRKVRFSIIMKNKVLQKSYMKVGGQEVATSRNGASEDVGSACGEDGKRKKVGLKSIETLPENRFWNEVGCRRSFLTLVVRMKVSAMLVTRRKVQKSTGSTIAQNGTRS